MNNPEGDQKSSESVGKRRVPKCSKCRNHKIISTKRGHKSLCQFEACNCPKCRVTDEKRAIMKAHVKIRRQLDKEDNIQKSLQSGPSTQVVENPITLPSIDWSFSPLVSNIGSQSTISEVSQQSWGSIISASAIDSTEDNSNLLFGTNDRNIAFQ